MATIKKIAIIGPESTGKSSLCQQLATHYQSIWVKEFARAYLLQHGTHYSFAQLQEIAKGQLQCEQDALAALSQLPTPPTGYLPLFADTEMYVMKTWCEFVFGKCHRFILDEAAVQHYDMYLLCNIDLPWTKDELREYPDLRSRQLLFHHYKDILVHQHRPWAIISGQQQQRFENALQQIEKFL
jgi:nicotinamide riboside kinase